jgi:serine/threonine-protein phosphatase 2A regulatory subunit A
LEPLIELAHDHIPNIRFNVSKSLEVIALSFGNTPEGKEVVRLRIMPTLEEQKTDMDADVRYFAARAAQKIQGM